jgi:IS30 family transposase
MLIEEDDVEIHALARRGWSKSAIARHTGRDRRTIRKHSMSDRVYQQLREHLAYLKHPAVAEGLAGALEHAEQDKPSYTRWPV